MPNGPDVRIARQLQPPRRGLLAIADVRDQDSGVRWGVGVEWQSEMHLGTSEAFGARPLGCGTVAIPMGADDKAPMNEAYPFAVHATDWCSAFGWQARDYVGRARRLLEATQSMLIAREFWSGAIAKSYATAAVVVGSGATGSNFTGQAVTFNLNIDGVVSAINLNTNYTNAAGVVAAINTQTTNADPATQNGGVITLTSPTTGASSQVTITSYAAGSVATGLGNTSVIGNPQLDNTWLGKSTAVEVASGAALTPVKAIAALDADAAVRLANGPAWFHMDVEVLGRAVAAQALRRDGDRWVTPFGNIVVADAGYSGLRDGEGSTRWVIATTPVEITLGAVRTQNLETPADWLAAFDYLVNNITVWAERDVIVIHEPALLHSAVQVDLT